MLKPLYKTLKLLSGKNPDNLLVTQDKNAVFGSKTLMCDIKSQQSSASASAQPISSEVYFTLIKLNEENINFWKEIVKTFRSNGAGKQSPDNQMTDGFTAFSIGIRLYDDFKEDWWIAYASSVHYDSVHNISNIEMLMCVATQVDSIISTHIGIFRNTTKFYNSHKHKNLSTELHAFAGYAINLVYPLKRQYMITKPTLLMNYIIKKYYDENVIPGQLIIGTNRNINFHMNDLKKKLLYSIQDFIIDGKQMEDKVYIESFKFTIQDIYNLLNVVCEGKDITIYTMLRYPKFKNFFEAYHSTLVDIVEGTNFEKLCVVIQQFLYTFNMSTTINPKYLDETKWCIFKSQIIEDDVSFFVKNNREYIIKPSWFSRHMHLKDHNDWLYMRLESCPEIWSGKIYCTLCNTLNPTNICITCNNPLKIYTKRLLEQQLHTPLVPIASTATE
jgi:hypothetical protein